MSVACECYVLSGRSVCWAYHLSRGILSSVVCLSVITIPY